MRFMVMVKASKDSEAGVMPSERDLAEMGKFNEEMVKAGVMLAGEGLHPSSKGARVKFSNGKPTVIDGPFTETKELIAGFSMIDVGSRQGVDRLAQALAGERCRRQRRARAAPGLRGGGIRRRVHARDVRDRIAPARRDQPACGRREDAMTCDRAVGTRP